MLVSRNHHHTSRCKPTTTQVSSRATRAQDVMGHGTRERASNHHHKNSCTRVSTVSSRNSSSSAVAEGPLAPTLIRLSRVVATWNITVAASLRGPRRERRRMPPHFQAIRLAFIADPHVRTRRSVALIHPMHPCHSLGTKGFYWLSTALPRR